MTTSSADSSDKSASKPRTSWLERACLLAVILGCAVAMSPNAADPDLWGHVTYGIDAMRDGLAETTTYSYTAIGYRWVNHENIAELVMAATAVNFGAVGLLVLKCCFGVTIISTIAWWARRNRVEIAPLAVVLILVALNIAYWWAVRPQMFSFLYFALLIALVNWAFDGWAGRWHWPTASGVRKGPESTQPEAYAPGSPNDLGYCSWRMRWLWLAPFIFFLWANTHGGFVAGLCIYTAILGLRAVEALLVRGRHGWGLVRRMSLMIAVAWLATLVNPYGPGLHQWLLGSLGTPRPEISEWSPLRFGAEPFIPFAVLATLAVTAIFFGRRKLDLTHLALLGITAWQSIEHERHIPFFAILFGFWLPGHVQGLMERLKFTQPGVGFADNLSPAMKKLVAAGLCLAFVVMGARLYQRLSDLPVKRREFPVSALEYIAQRDLHGKLVVTFNWAQYAIAAVGPTTPEGEDGLLVQFDGRFRTCYPQEIVDMHFDFVLGEGPEGTRYRCENSGEVDGQAVLQFAEPDLVLLNRKQWNSVDVMDSMHAKVDANSPWVLLYQDEIAQLWGQAAKYDDPRSPDFIPYKLRVISDAPQIGSVTWPALPQRQSAEGLVHAGRFDSLDL